MTSSSGDTNTRDEELLADLFDTLLQDILDGRTPVLAELHKDRPDLRERIAKTWQLACSVAGRREPSRPVLGGYEIVRELGHGGMGTVYLARHLTLQRDVAIKVLPHSLAMSPRAKQRFVEEARALAQIRHENVVHIHRIIDHAEMLAFEMEFVDGPSLQDLIVRVQKHARPHTVAALAEALGRDVGALASRSSVEWFVRIAIRIARALAEVHRHGLVHRDVKPGNILLRNDGVPLLADFGLALPEEAGGVRTKFAGTPVYAAPERLRGNDDAIDARTDVYSLGVTLYEALTTTPPFQGTTTHEVLRHIESGHAGSLRARAPHVSRDLATIVHKAIEPDPRHRYATADDFADDLERLLDLQPIQAQPAGPIRRTTKFVRRHQRVVLAALGGALLVLLGLWPLARHAAAAERRGAEALASLHAARTELLCPDLLPSWWGTEADPGLVLQQATREAGRRAAMAAARERYAAALALAPDDARIRLEHAVVEHLLDPARAPSLPPLCRSYATRAAAHQRLDEELETELRSASTDDRYAAGLFAFLLGDGEANERCWRDLPHSDRDDPWLAACSALQLAAEDAPERAYPRLFHAAHAFPRAVALAEALTAAAIVAGDLPLARRWIDELPPVADPHGTARRRLLAADLLAAEGDVEAAATDYRALCAADASDPIPLLRLATLTLRCGDRVRAQRMFESMLARWPNLASVRLQLARLCLQRRDTAGYLAHARAALGRLRGAAGPSTPALRAILELGGLPIPNATTSTMAPRAPVRSDAIPLDSWLPRDHVVGIARALQVLAAYDEASIAATKLDGRPLGVALRAAWRTLLEVPRLPVHVPWQAELGLLLGIPWLLGTPVDHLTAELLPYERALGTRFHTIPRRVLFHGEADPELAYGLEMRRVGDVDGDTLDDFVVTAPPVGRETDGAFLELRSCIDGTLLRQWPCPPAAADAMFGRAIASLGDLDGDLCSDLVIGMPGLRQAAKGAIEAWSGRTGQRLWRVEADETSFGAALATTADLDGDGHLDVIVGAPPMSLQHPGHAEVRSGRDGHLLHELRSERTGIWFGAAVGDAGDVTGDGVADVVVGGNFGRAPGLVVVFDGRTGRVHSSFADEDQGALFGHSVSTAGDLDGDGHADLLVAAPGGGSAAPGRVLALSGRTGKPLYELHGERPRDGFGVRVQRLPDWRRNRRPALVVASHHGGPIGNGYLRVFDLGSGAPLQTFAAGGGVPPFGQTMVDLGDLDGDGLRDLGVATVRTDGAVEIVHFSFADATDPPPQPSPTTITRRPSGVLPK